MIKGRRVGLAAHVAHLIAMSAPCTQTIHTTFRRSSPVRMNRTAEHFLSVDSAGTFGTDLTNFVQLQVLLMDYILDVAG
jgi:hypothetical protein